MFLTVVLSSTMTGVLSAVTVGSFPGIGIVRTNAMGAFMGICGDTTPALRVGVYTEIWTGELAKALRSGLVSLWLDDASDQSSIIDNNVIHLVEMDVDPGVLINNTTYPIPMQALEGKDIAISLDKFQSRVTPIIDDELYAISYGEMARVEGSHDNATNDAKFAKAARALCAAEHTAKVLVSKIIGDADEGTGCKRLTPNDLVEVRHALDKLKVPSENRRLVPRPDHVNDLSLVSQNFREQYNIDYNTDKVGNLCGFQVYEYGSNPVCTTVGKKEATGAASDTGEFQRSPISYTPRMFKAMGSTKTYFSEAQKDLEYQRNRINFRHYFICMFKKAGADVVMMSGYAASELPEG